MTDAGGEPALTLGYWLSSEEHGPNDLVRFAAQAEQAGFTVAGISDHYHPWLEVQGQAPFVWSVLGGIAQVTSRLRVGTGVTAPIRRLHPAVIAQAAATAATMLEGRFFLGLGTGERLNEHVTGDHWPPSGERRSILREAVSIIRALLDGDEVTCTTDHFRVEHAQLFNRPDRPPPIYLAGSSTPAATLAGEVGDGFIGVLPSARFVDAFEGAGGYGKPRIGQVHLCWAATADEALDTAHRVWANAAVPGRLVTELSRPADFDQVAQLVSRDAVAAKVACGPDPAVHLDAIAEFAKAGYDHVLLHQIGPDQDGFFRFCETELLPAVTHP